MSDEESDDNSDEKSCSPRQLINQRITNHHLLSQFAPIIQTNQEKIQPMKFYPAVIKGQENVWAIFKKQFDDVIEKQLTKKMKEVSTQLIEPVLVKPQC